MKITASFVLVLIVTVCLSMVCNYFIGLSFMVIVVSVWLSNKLLKRHIRLTNCEKIDYMNDKRRNFDAIVIGLPLNDIDQSKIKGKSILSFTHPKRTLFASYLFLIHQYSYLREDGKGTIYISSLSDTHEEQNYVTIMDVYNFHPVINKRLNVGLSLRYPIFFYRKKFHARKFFRDGNKISIKERMIDFCKERGINIEFLIQ